MVRTGIGRSGAFPPFGWVMVVVAVTFWSGCSDASDRATGTAVGNDSGGVPIEFDAGQADRLLHFYFGSYLGPDGGDPVEAGILEKRENTWYLREPVADNDAYPFVSGLFEQASERGVLDADMLETFIQQTYYQARAVPATLEDFIQRVGQWQETDWFRVDVKGSMVPHLRSTWVQRGAILEALQGMESMSDPILYPVGTSFVGEHLLDGSVIETTVMQKRTDGYWDYWAYDAQGQLTNVIRKDPRDMIIPTRCTGCHYGDRAFEPERSYPGLARPGPSGERALYVPDAWRREDIANGLEEHARRSDTVLGLYATLFLAEAASGSGTPDAESVLARFGIQQRPQ